MSGIALLLARVVLAAVLSTAGIAKLADRRGSREAMLGFGVPERLAEVLGLSWAAIELIIATHSTHQLPATINAPELAVPPRASLEDPGGHHSP